MDKYDYLILDIIQNFKENNRELIRLAILEKTFWKRIENDVNLSVGQAKIGERITNLYLDGMIQNKGGYMLTKKGREELSCQFVS
jgi:predicted transcriptional regulator